MTAQSSLEHLDIGSDVLGSDGEKVGSVAYLVIDPTDLHLTDLVVNTGALLGRDVLVPVDVVGSITPDGVQLTVDKDTLATYQNYIDVEYTRPPEGWIAPPDFAAPMSSIVWPMGSYGALPQPTHVNAPKGSVGLSEGMEVQSSDGHRVGSLRAVDNDPASDDIRAIVVKEGHLFGHDVTIPADRIERIDEGLVVLTLTQDEAKAEFSEG
jgi:uncharacterized protein YrrD